MVETTHHIHSYFNIPVYSLYSKTRVPSDEMLEGIDHLFIDLQDVGCRVYTYIYTLALLLDKCIGKNIEIIVLDHPNPINGVGISPIQISDYLTENPFVVGEELKMINEQYWVATFGNGLESSSNWKRSGYPELIPIDAAASLTGGEIPRRFVYPGSEKLNNPDNVAAATAQQGGDELTTRMWWDAN